jgi:brefeldin A-resistance guanine nucleotide exchange factor 1
MVQHAFLGVLLEPTLYGEQAREVVLRGLCDLVRVECLLPDLYANYDCSMTSQNLFERLVQVICKLSFPVSRVLLLTHRLAFQCLIALLEATASHLDGMPRLLSASLDAAHGGGVSDSECGSGEGDSEGTVREARKLSRMKLTKRSLAAAADAFNQERKVAKGIELLRVRGIIAASDASAAKNGEGRDAGGSRGATTCGFVSNGLAAADLAQFLRVAGYLGLDKGKVGDFLGEKDALNLAVLNEYANTFDFAEVPLVEALRAFLQGFQLPGESQKIDRITEAFAKSYFAQQRRTVFHTWDGVHILTFSIIMLNTDLHSPQIKKRMSIQEFIRNNRGINQDKDRNLYENVPQAVLEEVYHTVAANEIRLQTADLKAAQDRSAGGPAVRQTSEQLLQRQLDHVAAVRRALQVSEYQGDYNGDTGY